MDKTDIRRKFWWFTVLFFILLSALAWFLCHCFPWSLFITMYVFFVFYLILSIGGKRMLDRYQLNPMYYTFLSFFTKVLLVFGFAALLIQFFDLPRKTLLLLVVVGYLIAAIFDFILLLKTTENRKE